jgi:hypothetical protein
MKAFNITLALFLYLPAVYAGKEVDRLLAEYSKIESVSCKIRRTKEGQAGKMKFLSRVYWTDQDQIHAEGITPVKRRTIADGKQLFQYNEGDPKGFSRPVSELSEQMTISLRFVPGTAMDHLLRLKGLDEEILPTSDGFAKCVGIEAGNRFVALKFDGQDRLAGIDFYDRDDRSKVLADYDYSGFSEPLPGVWIPHTHIAQIHNDKMSFKETVKVDSFIANKPVAQSLFIPANFFHKDIDFVDDFAKIFPE